MCKACVYTPLSIEKGVLLQSRNFLITLFHSFILFTPFLLGGLPNFHVIFIHLAGQSNQVSLCWKVGWYSCLLYLIIWSKRHWSAHKVFLVVDIYLWSPAPITSGAPLGSPEVETYSIRSKIHNCKIRFKIEHIIARYDWQLASNELLNSSTC